ncbi:MAG TPA: DUF983 domain-containing protein [Xanthobacteraceae bacterium]|jgi:uncharacterized protein (DUF983 family)|nr:DUF983 domain-containing protein [Xanthobacteraceae bacterium]
MTSLTDLPLRDGMQALSRGFRGRCPNCGEGRIFRAFLKVADRCDVCGEELHHHRADDAPAYFVILITGHIVVPLSLSVETAFAPPYWLHALMWLPLTLGLALGLLQPIKGAIVAWQWAHYMHGFGEIASESEPALQPIPANRTYMLNAPDIGR